MDVTFREDSSRNRLGDSAENSAVVRPVAFTLLTYHPAKLSLNRQRFQAPLDEHVLLQLLTQV